MYVFINVIIFVLGLTIGSFLNCLIYRLEQEESVVGRSYCPHCKHLLSWNDLIPVFSFLFLRGRCRYCKQKISQQYPIVELLTGVVFLAIFNVQFSMFSQFSIPQFLNLLFLFYIASSLLVILVYDLKHYLIPDTVLFPAILVTLFYQVLFNPRFLVFNSLWVAIAGFLFFWSIFYISKEEWMGFGDCKLVVLLGLLLGFPKALLALFLSFFFGAIIGVGFMMQEKKGLKSQIPFAPFLILGTLLAMVFGDSMIRWYMQLMYL